MKRSKALGLALSFIPLFILALTFAAPFGALADTSDAGSSSTGSGKGANTQKDLSIAFKLKNPLSGTDSIQGFLLNVLDAVVYIMIPVIVVMMIYAGFLFVTARGNSEKLGQAKNALLYTVIGAAIVLGAKGFALAIESTIKQF